jgi:hypothetical protein
MKRGEKIMNIDKAILIMRNELECVKRADKCDRHCEDCPLVMKAEDIIECYKWIIDQLEKQKRIVDELCKKPAVEYYGEGLKLLNQQFEHLMEVK